MHRAPARQGEAVQGVDARGLEQLLAEGAAEPVDMAVHVPAGVVEEHAPGQRVAVGVQPAAGQGQHGITRPHPVRAEQVVGLHHASGGSGDVVLVGPEQAGVLGGLATHQGGSSQSAALGHARDDRGDALGHHAAAGDVVGDEQRLGSAHDEVVHEHAHQVLPDGVVPVHPLGHRHLGADPVGGGRQQRVAVAPQG